MHHFFTSQTKKHIALAVFICVIYFLSGFTALAYEVLWARMLSTIFGVSTFGIVVTVSAFMAGLGLGALVGLKLKTSLKTPLLIFAIVEITVALFAFNLPSIYQALDIQLQTISSSETYSTWLVYQAVATFIMMSLPAFALGLAFPMILRVVNKLQVSLGVIYSLNTLGGVFGALIPLVLLPSVGWIVSDRLIALLGFFLGGLAFVVYFILLKKLNIDDDEADVTTQQSPGLIWLLAYAGIGASAIALQIIWTRLYGMILLRTEYVMAIILSIFLIGIGIGSLLAARSKEKYWLLVLPLVISISALASLIFLPSVATWVSEALYTSLYDSMVHQALLIMLFTLPATLAFGAWFPILATQFSNVQKSGSFLYGVNSIGAAIGGLVTGFVLLPFFGSAIVIYFSIAVVLICSLVWNKQTHFKVVSGFLLLAAIPFISFPEVNQLLPETQDNSKDLMVYEDSVSLTHVVEDENGQRLLLADLQRMDASSEPSAVTVQKNQARLPLLLHDSPESVLFLGLGTGITASGSIGFGNINVTAVELSAGAIKAAKDWFPEINENISNKITVIQDDARRYLKSTNEHYDVIVGDLFHPDLVGRSALLSLQQFTRAKKKLNQDGLFVQWVALNQFDFKTLQIVLATFKDVFPKARVYLDGFRLALIGVNGKFSGIEELKARFSNLETKDKIQATGGEGFWAWVSRYWGEIDTLEKRVQDEWAPIIEFQLPKAKYNRQIDLPVLLKYLMSKRPSLEQATSQLGVMSSDQEIFKAAFVANEMYISSWIENFNGNSQKSQELISLAYSIHPDDQWIGFALADSMFASINQAESQGVTKEEALKRILNVRSNHMGALKELNKYYTVNGKLIEAEKVKDQIREISPYDKEFKS